MKWQPPLDISRYDRRPDLDDAECEALASLVLELERVRKFPRRTSPTLNRIFQPLDDVLAWFDPNPRMRNAVFRFCIREMHQQQKTYWGWSEATWLTFLKPTNAPTRKDINHHLMTIALILVGFTNFRQALPFQPERYVSKVFGAEVVHEAVETVCHLLVSWGFSGKHMYLHVNRCLCYMFIKNCSPYLCDLNDNILWWMYEQGSSIGEKAWVPRISRVLVHLGVISKPIELDNPKQPSVATVAEIAEEWLSWCKRWYDTTLVSGKTRKSAFFHLLKVGRWLYKTHPEVVSPADWTRDTVTAALAMIHHLHVGDYVSSTVYLNPQRVGQPMLPQSKKGMLSALSLFFRDCQNWEWMPVRFNAARCFAIPRSLNRLIGPSPRVIADDIWAKLLWAGMNLTEQDLPLIHIRHHVYPLEFFRAIAVMWLFAGLRLGEIIRLRSGCIRWEPGVSVADKDAPPTVCLLDVPVTKTSTAFTKPVAAVVGSAVEAWEKVRPAQPSCIDLKTGEAVHFLFAYRGKQVGHYFLNHTLIPILCQKAGIPESDARGGITSHRARATIASQLANTRQPMSLLELQQWLGHQNPNSTRWYVRPTPMRLTQSYTEAGYFDRNLRMITVLLDQEAIRNGAAANGEAWRYYDLGHGYCTYDFFDQCSHRMACAKCSFYMPKEDTRIHLLEAQGNLQRMLQEIPLTDEEQAAVEDGMEALTKLEQRLRDVPTPSGLTPRELQNRSGFIPLESISTSENQVP